MKILFVTNLPSPYRVEFFSELAKECDLTVLYDYRSSTERNPLWKAQSQNNFKSVFLKGLHFGTHWCLSWAIIKYLKQDFDLVIISSYEGLTEQLAISYLRQHRIPFALSSDGGFIGDDFWLKKKLKTYLIGSASYYFSPGKFTDKYLEYYGAQATQIYHYPFTSLYQREILPRTLSVAEKQQLRRKLNLPGLDYNLVISVGVPIRRKGFDLLVQAIEALDDPRTKLLLVGASRAEYEKTLGRKLSSKVLVVDFLTKPQLWKYYQAVDVFVLATRYDIWGLVINEALANGLPVITTDRCGAGLELIENGVNGYLVKSESVAALRQALELTLAQQPLLAENSRHKIQEHSYEGMVQAHILAIKKIINHQD
ncbi:glycosyltransferase family 4 protein [Lactobacillus sp. DCY120]|uniref:Glycosyltransferase family 4 protein n=1 Tax=Bombilactobacillus apium TaxID=2675299 RepID=A0A850R6M5_9LACO|nr:glycosyltransferase family 4 protein [Bombilactobacillus apium]NVY96195.1 glycosyltransferase family 4 protein [Bombilactobacillus apium]